MQIPLALSPAGFAFDVVGFGSTSVDLFAVLDAYPPNGSKQRLRQHLRLPGGSTATALVGCQRLGWRTRFVGRLGGDDEGRLVRESLIAEGVGVHAHVVPGARNQFAIILVDRESGERTVLWDRDAALDGSPEAIEREALVSGRILLVDAGDVPSATAAAAAARRHGVVTAIDIEQAGPGTTELLREIDLLVVAETFPSAITGKAETGAALHALAAELKPALACVTLGAAGSLAICQGREIRTPGFPVRCTDTTGAGDAFRAGLLSGWLAQPDADVADLLRRANAVAALNCRALGAWAGLPTASEIEHFLAAEGT
ncbi:MAG TPA: carbohydrate kinase family protein [Vicinamibacterales bacterium]